VRYKQNKTVNIDNYGKFFLDFYNNQRISDDK